MMEITLVIHGILLQIIESYWLPIKHISETLPSMLFTQINRVKNMNYKYLIA